MIIFLFLLNIYLLEIANNRIIYQCARNYGRYNQCLNKWVDQYGNTRIDLWKCSNNKICQTLSRNDNNDDSIGVCAYNYKKLYDKDSCSYHSECSSNYCSSGKCEGLIEDDYCSPGIFQCKNNLVCKKRKEYTIYKEIRDVFRCSNLSKINETCEYDYECDVRLVCTNKQIIDMINNTKSKNISELKNEILYENYTSTKKNNKKRCIQYSSLENGLPTTEPMACKSGDSINIEIFPNYNETLCVSKKEIIEDCNEENFCIIKANLGKFGDIIKKQDCFVTVRGNYYCPLNEKEIAWNHYLKLYDKYYKEADVDNKRDSKIHIPAHKYTFDILEVSQAYWYYSMWNYSIDADSCTKEYFYLRSKGTIMKFSMIFVILQYLLV